MTIISDATSHFQRFITLSASVILCLFIGRNEWEEIPKYADVCFAACYSYPDSTETRRLRHAALYSHKHLLAVRRYYTRDHSQSFHQVQINCITPQQFYCVFLILMTSRATGLLESRAAVTWRLRNGVESPVMFSCVFKTGQKVIRLRVVNLSFISRFQSISNPVCRTDYECETNLTCWN